MTGSATDIWSKAEKDPHCQIMAAGAFRFLQTLDGSPLARDFGTAGSRKLPSVGTVCRMLQEVIDRGRDSPLSGDQNSASVAEILLDFIRPPAAA